MKKTKANNVFTTAMFISLTMISFNLFAQEQKKEYMKEKDNFKWYRIYENGHCGALNKRGKVLIPFDLECDSILYNTYYKMKWFSVYRDGKQGICDIEGHVIIEPKKYDFICYDSHDGKEHGKKTSIGFNVGVDEIGKDGDFLIVEVEGKYGACDENGVELIEPIYDCVDYRKVSFVDNKLVRRSYGFFLVNQQQKIGAFDTNGNVIIEIGKYDHICYLYGNTAGYFKVKKNGKYGACDRKGRCLLEPKYNSVYWELGHPGNFVCDGNRIDYITLDQECHACFVSETNPSVSNSYDFSRMLPQIISVLLSPTPPAYNGEANYLLDPNYAIWQTEQQNRVEYAQFCQQFKKPDGSNFTYEEFIAAKAKVWAETQGQGSVSDGGSTGNLESNTTTSQSNTHKCGLCNGTGRVVENNATSFGNTKYCSECGKTVPDSHYHTTCPSCKGKGYW